MPILSRDCPHCGTAHVAFTVTWSTLIRTGRPNLYACAATCGSCRYPISFLTFDSEGTVDPMAVPGALEPRHPVVDVWPRVVASAAPRHVPSSIARRFVEGEDAYRRKSWNAAVAMYRSALDIATKSMPDVMGETFFARLHWLAENHRITADIRSWADHVRVDGNAALHDVEEFAEEDAKPLRFFTEMFLRYVYELPGEVAAFRADTDTAA